MNALHGHDIEVSKDIWVFNDYYSREYEDSFYNVGFYDWRKPDLDAFYVGEYFTKEEADQKTQELIDLAKKYEKSLLKDLYSFEDYLRIADAMQEGASDE